MARKRTIRDVDVVGKRLLMRMDFDVPLRERGQIADDRRIRDALPTIKYALSRGAAVVLMSHLGGQKPGAEKAEPPQLDCVASRLSQLLPEANVRKCDQVVGLQAKRCSTQLRGGDVLVLENLQFHPGERNADAHFAKQLRSLGDIYVNDAFATCHQQYASTCVLPQQFPRGCRVVGFLVERELTILKNMLQSPRRPLIAVVGGASVASNRGLIKAMQRKTDRILIGGATAYAFLQRMGISVGATPVKPKELHVADRLLDHAGRHFVLPTDHVVADCPELPARVRTTEGDIEPGWYGMDIGPRTRQSFCKMIAHAGTVIWSGRLGKLDDERFRNGTRSIARALANTDAITVIVSAETVTAVRQFGLADRMTHLSTGGEAFLKYLEGDSLPALAAIDCRGGC